jgi:hypothetical protein
MNKTQKKSPSNKRTTKKKLVVTNSEKQDWETVSSNQTIEHNGKKYKVFVIPENTYVYRGFSYGDDPSKEREQDRAETIMYNEEEYHKRKNAGVYYANLAIAAYYAYNPDRGRKWKHVVVEYKTKQPIKVLDMTVWQNLKNVVDDVPELAELFESTHGFHLKKPKTKLKRFSGGLDEEMTELMVGWLQSNPEFDGFGHVVMTGFHSEFVCLDRNKLSEENEYVSDNYVNRQLVNTKYLDVKDIAIDLENLSFVEGAKKKQFKITSLLSK